MEIPELLLIGKAILKDTEGISILVKAPDGDTAHLFCHSVEMNLEILVLHFSTEIADLQETGGSILHAFFAAVSATSLRTIPQWLGHHAR